MQTQISRKLVTLPENEKEKKNLMFSDCTIFTYVFILFRMKRNVQNASNEDNI